MKTIISDIMGRRSYSGSDGFKDQTLGIVSKIIRVSAPSHPVVGWLPYHRAPIPSFAHALWIVIHLHAERTVGLRGWAWREAGV